MGANNSNNYEVIKTLGKGGFGEVFLVRKENNIYALKKLLIHSSGLTKEKISEYKNMINILSRINNEYVIKYYDTFIEDNYFCILMEYGGDSNLKQFIKKYKDKEQLIEENIIENIIKQIILGLKAIHNEKLIHRDLTPENIFINENNIIKIGDFGVSTQLSTNQNYAKTSTGKLHYNAPEIEKNEKYNNKVDIYALGCIIYELFTLNEYYIDVIIDKKDGNINTDIYNPNWQDFIELLLKRDYHERPPIEEVFGYSIKKNLIYDTQAVFQSKEFLEIKLDEYNGNEELIMLKEIQEDIKNNYGLSKNSLDYRGNKVSGWNLNKKIGNILYHPPLGWIAFGLNVKDKYDNDDWLGNSNNTKEWCIAYHGVGRNQSSDMIKKIIGKIFNKSFRCGINYRHYDCKDIYHIGKKVGIGVFFTPNPTVAEDYAGILEINEKKYKIIIMVRVRPDAIRGCNCLGNNYWVVNGSSDEVRPYRILYKIFK